MVPSSQTLCEYHQPRSEVGFYYTATQWALTFPNLRRHLMLTQFNIKNINVNLTLHYTSRFVPIAKEFLCVMCSFSTANMLSISTSEPDLFGGFHTLVCQSICTCASIRELFPQRYFLIWPANLMCWNVLPVCDVLTMPV